MFKVNLKKRRYIKNRTIVGWMLLISGASRQECYRMGRGAAFCAMFSNLNEQEQYSRDWSKMNLSTFGQMVRWALVYTAVSKPLLAVVGILSLPLIPISFLMKVF